MRTSYLNHLVAFWHDYPYVFHTPAKRLHLPQLSMNEYEFFQSFDTLHEAIEIMHIRMTGVGIDRGHLCFLLIHAIKNAHFVNIFFDKPSAQRMLRHVSHGDNAVPFILDAVLEVMANATRLAHAGTRHHDHRTR